MDGNNKRRCARMLGYSNTLQGCKKTQPQQRAARHTATRQLKQTHTATRVGAPARTHTRWEQRRRRTRTTHASLKDLEPYFRGQVRSREGRGRERVARGKVKGCALDTTTNKRTTPLRLPRTTPTHANVRFEGTVERGEGGKAGAPHGDHHHETTAARVRTTAAAKHKAGAACSALAPRQAAPRRQNHHHVLITPSPPHSS